MVVANYIAVNIDTIVTVCSRPRLNLMCSIVRGPGKSGEVLEFKVALSILNDDRGTARALHIQ